MTPTYALGIDLGTTNSAIAYYKSNIPQVIENEDGSRITPSVVAFEGIQPVVGKLAQQRSETNPKICIFDAKRFIGQTYPTLPESFTKYPFDIKLDEETNEVYFEILQNGSTTPIRKSPKDISSIILAKLLEWAKQRLHDSFIPKAVITVPAYFTCTQREETKAAANLAGIEVLGLLNEPTAAAIYHVHNTPEINQTKTTLVYDLGGGTFDVSIIQMRRQRITVKAIDGDISLGGTDFDEHVMNIIQNQIRSEFNYDITSVKNKNKIRRILRRLRAKCVEVKHGLTTEPSYNLNLEGLVPQNDENDDDDDNPLLTITREIFERENKTLFDRTMAIIQKCLQENDIKQDEIDEILLVGGSSRIPRIRQLLTDYFGVDKLRQTVNPDESVALGAAIYAAKLYKNPKSLQNFKLIDVLSYSLGTDVTDKQMSFILKRNTPLPVQKCKRYKTIRDNQTHFNIQVYEGEDIWCKNNRFLGEVHVDGIQPAPKGDIKLDLTFAVDVDGILHVTAVELMGNNVRELTIALNHGNLEREEFRIRRATGGGEAVNA